MKFANVTNLITPRGGVTTIARGTEVLWKKYVTPVYTELEYIEGTGTQWLDIGVTINTSTDEVELTFQNLDANNYKWLFGEHDNNARFGLGSGDGANKRNVAYGKNTYKVNDTQQYNSSHTFVANGNGVFIDGTKIAGFASFASTSTLYLFNLNLSGGNYVSKARVWRYQHRRDGILIRDLIPVLDMNNVPCMYDKVTRSFFYNDGTGTFLYKGPPYKTELAYLESTGTQYIDTGYVPNSKTAIEMVVSGVSADSFSVSSGTWFIGARAAYLKNAFGFYYNPTDKKMFYAFGNGMLSGSYPSTSLYGAEKKISADVSGLYIDGTKAVSVSAGDFVAPVSLALFGLNNNGSVISHTKYNMHYCKLWDNGNLIHDFIPVLDWDDNPCMYDKVSGELFYNKGTGDFSYGTK